MNNYKVVGSFSISPNLKQLSLHKYAINLEKVFINIQTYIKLNSVVSISSKHNIISYILPDYKIKLHKLSTYLIPKFKNIKIKVYYKEKDINNNVVLSFNELTEKLTFKRRKKLKSLSSDQIIILNSNSKISKIVIDGLLLNSNLDNNIKRYTNKLDEKIAIKNVVKWFANSHIYSINKLVDILDNISSINQEDKINLVRNEMAGVSNDFINSGIINEVCNKLEKIILIK
jgi:hypothetical protein